MLMGRPTGLRAGVCLPGSAAALRWLRPLRLRRGVQHLAHDLFEGRGGLLIVVRFGLLPVVFQNAVQQIFVPEPVNKMRAVDKPTCTIPGLRRDSPHERFSCLEAQKRSRGDRTSRLRLRGVRAGARRPLWMGAPTGSIPVTSTMAGAAGLPEGTLIKFHRSVRSRLPPPSTHAARMPHDPYMHEFRASGIPYPNILFWPACHAIS